MRNFLTSCFGTIVGIFVTCILGFVILVGTVSSLGSENKVVITDQSVLYLKLDKPISELELEDPLANILPGSLQESIGLIDLKRAIRQAKNDSKIEGIYLTVSSVMAGFATIEEIRLSLKDFKSSGKWIVAYSDYYTEGAYYLASVADKVYLNPAGQIELNGLEAEVTYFKKLFDKLEIKPQVFRVGDFKSAVEPFLREDMSPENKLQLTQMIQSIYQQEVAGIAESRNLPVERVKEIADKMLARNGELAIEYGLIDGLLYDDQLKDEMKERLGVEKETSIKFASYHDYKGTITSGSSKNEIAVIVADGNILPGKSDRGVVGSTTIREAVKKARNDDDVKAIIIRVNSPGGAFSASDEMWREISMASKEKVVIASMGDYAASGGYYIAMACDTIVAQPTTITGSIGVFSVLFDLSDFLGNKLGVTSERVRTGEIGNMITVTRPLTEQEKNIWQRQTEETYEIFAGKAAEGRHMPIDELKKVASGRVWTGTQALDRKLVDVLGSFDDAVQLAAQKAGIEDDYKLYFYPKQKNFVERLMSDYQDDVRVTAMQNEMGAYYPWYQQWRKVRTYEGVQARMPLEYTIQ